MEYSENERNMVGFYIFLRDLMLPKRTILLFWSLLSFFRSVCPQDSLEQIFSTHFTNFSNSFFGKKIAQRSGFQRKFEDKYSSYEGKAIPKASKTKVFEHDFTPSKCSYSGGNCLFLFPLPLLVVRGLYFTLFPMYRKQGILSFVCV
mgnify:FL=1